MCLQLAHPVLDALRGSDKQWLVDLLFAFNAGDIPRFEQLKPQWQKQVLQCKTSKTTLKSCL